jgi:hypothetical protein
MEQSKRKEKLVACVLVAFSIVYSLGCLGTKVGKIENPGAGLIPWLIAILLILFTTINAVKAFKSNEKSNIIIKEEIRSYSYLAVIGIAGVILVTQGTRRIPVQYAKRVVGRKVYGGVTQYIPMRVNTAGVMPIIFAQSIMFIPQTIATFFKDQVAQAFAWPICAAARRACWPGSVRENRPPDRQPAATMSSLD